MPIADSLSARLGIVSRIASLRRFGAACEIDSTEILAKSVAIRTRGGTTCSFGVSMTVRQGLPLGSGHRHDLLKGWLR